MRSNVYKNDIGAEYLDLPLMNISPPVRQVAGIEACARIAPYEGVRVRLSKFREEH